MPITIDLTDHALFKRGEKSGFEKKTRIAVANMLERDMPIKDIAEILDISVNEVIAIKNELEQQK